MDIKSFDRINDNYMLFDKDSNGRVIYEYQLKNVVATGESLYYPNTLFKTMEYCNLIKPINETTMSLKTVIKEGKLIPEVAFTKIETDNMFFFVYNTDNYFHFMYDTLPYLITYNDVLKTDPNMKLLMNYPNPNKLDHYKFVIEMLEILGIKNDKIRLINNTTLYESIILSTSYTHDFDSNLPPRIEVYDFFKEIVNKFKYSAYAVNLPKKIYVSRRTWLHGDLSNIGTNYTSRRKMMNEDALVEFLVSKGYTEVFTENMSSEEKIVMFANAEKVIGAIGGGLCNVLFGNKNCDLISIVSPGFIEVNERFKYSFNNVNTTLFDKVSSFETTDLKTNMRVKVGSVVGEITNIDNDDITIAYSDTTIAGWNNDVEYKKKKVKAQDCEKLDNGLNSPWVVNLEEFKKLDL